MDVFIDEAGDLGFGERSSHTFVIAYVIPKQPELMRNSLKRLMKRLNQRNAWSISEFRFSGDRNDVRLKVFNAIKELQFDLGYVVIDKRLVRQQLRNNPPLLYRYLVVNSVITALVSNFDLKELKLVVDKSLTKESQKPFDDYARNKLSWRQVVENQKDMPRLEVKHLDSRSDVCLQMADYCSGAAFVKFERGDATYFNSLRGRIKFRNSWGDITW